MDDFFNYFNGVNHDLAFYNPDPVNFTTNRKKNVFILRNPSLHPSFILRKQIPLNSNSVELPLVYFYGNGFKLPRVLYQPDIVPDFWKYDVILVSEVYASDIIRLSHTINPDYLDRLFTVDRKVIHGDQTLGWCGLRKLFVPQPGDYYIRALKFGCSPSLAAALLCFNQIQNNASLKNDLFICIKNEEKRRSDLQSFVS